MQTRTLGRTGRSVSVIGLGTWQLGADWGEVEEADALAVLDAAYAAGVTVFDTADVYGDGRSESLIGTWLKANAGSGVTLVAEDRIRNYGVSVETVEEALTAIARPGVASVQIILNAFRLKPLDEVLPAADRAGVGIIARVPLASGLLSGRYTMETTFAADDHRTYNRHGEAFDVGETFSGVDYATGVRAASEFSALVAEQVPGATPAQAALAWIAALPQVSTVIPGARSTEQATANAAAGSIELPAGFDDAVRGLYDTYFREAIHSRW